jgi:hypothetical protein
MTSHKWSAKWLWQNMSRRAANDHLLFRKDFRLDAVGPARLFIAVESFAVVYLNGRRVHHTTSISYPGQHYYEEVDLSGAVQPGRNRLAVLARYIGVPSGNSCPQDPGLLCELVIDQPGGEPLVVASDKSWRVLQLDAWPGALRRSDKFNLDLVEIMDYRKLPAGFPMIEDLAAFEESQALREPGVRRPGLEPRPFALAPLVDYHDFTVVQAGHVADRSAATPDPALAVASEQIVPADLGITGAGDFTVSPPPAGQAAVVLFDLGKYMKGYPALEAEGCPGAVIDIAYHENLVVGIFEADRYILSGHRDMVMTDEWKGLRYLKLTFRNVTRPLAVRNCRLVQAEYPVTRKIRFSSSDPKLDRIVEISLNASRMCMQDNIMDCPWREKRQWIGDVQRIILVNHHAFTDRNLVRAVLRQHVHLQDTSGRMWVCLPLYEEYPMQSMEWLRAVVEYEHYTGDTTLLDEVADNVEMLHRWFLKQRDERGLFFNSQPPVLNWMDNTLNFLIPPGFRTPLLVINLRYLQFLDDMVICFKRLGKPREARQAKSERARLAALIPGAFHDEQTGLLRDCADPAIPVTFSEMGHALAVTTGLFGDQAAAVWDRFRAFQAANPRGAKDPLSISDVMPRQVIRPGPFGKYCTFEALGRLGRKDEIVREIMAGWGPMVDAGSDTAWETFVPQGSWCHGWAGTPVVALMRYLFRLNPRKPGRRRLRNIAGIKWAECEVLA